MNSEALVRLEQALTAHTHRDAGEAVAEAEALNDEVGKTFPDVTDASRGEGRS
jgi:hypothetical protein